MKSEKQWGPTPFRALATIKQSHANADTTLIRHPARFDLRSIIEDAGKWEEKIASLPIHA